MDIRIDDLYKKWSGDSHTENSNKNVHDSADAQDFARFCIDAYKELTTTDEQDGDVFLVKSNDGRCEAHAHGKTKSIIESIGSIMVEDARVSTIILAAVEFYKRLI